MLVQILGYTPNNLSLSPSTSSICFSLWFQLSGCEEKVGRHGPIRNRNQGRRRSSSSRCSSTIFSIHLGSRAFRLHNTRLASASHLLSPTSPHLCPTPLCPTTSVQQLCQLFPEIATASKDGDYETADNWSASSSDKLMTSKLSSSGQFEPNKHQNCDHIYLSQIP